MWRAVQTSWRKNIWILQSHPSAYGIDVKGIDLDAGLDGLTSGTGFRGYPSPLRDPSLLGQRPEVALHLSPGIHDTNYERPSSLRRTNGLPVAAAESDIVFVDELPTDCSRRKSRDKAILCCVEFADAKCVLTAMEALQDELLKSQGIIMWKISSYRAGLMYHDFDKVHIIKEIFIHMYISCLHPCLYMLLLLAVCLWGRIGNGTFIRSNSGRFLLIHDHFLLKMWTAGALINMNIP